MTIQHHPLPDAPRPMLTALAGVAARVQAWLVGLPAVLAETSRQMQIARMHGILQQMSDKDLARIGADRNDLRAHAERLVCAPGTKE